jgi:uncharacterized protein (DUF4213/DUF364 family)
VLEKQPTGNYLPDVACEFLLSKADWFFITTTSIPNKIYPWLAQLASSAKTVLMEPTTLWLSQLRECDIDYLAGVEIVNPDLFEQTIAQGGGVKIFEQCERYRIADLGI